jgi:hypothetical protein
MSSTSFEDKFGSVEYAANNGTWDANDTTSFVYGPGGAAVTDAGLTTKRGKTVRFQTLIQAIDNIEIQFEINGTWVPAIGSYINSGGYAIQPLGYTTGANDVTSKGIGWEPVNGSNTDIIVYFGRYPTSYNGDTTVIGWDSFVVGTVNWRVVKSRN